MAKSKLKFQARILRAEGYGIKTIAHKLNVSTSTVGHWCRDISLTVEQIKELSWRAHDPYYGKRKENILKQQGLKNNKIKRLMEEGIKEVGHVGKRELFISGVALYWAEGFKKDNLAGFSNSDPAMIRYFIQWLEKCCSISKTTLKFRIGLNEQYKDKIDLVETYWRDYLQIDKSAFQKPFFQKVKWKKQYQNSAEYHGVIRVRVPKSTDLLRKMHGWIEGLRNEINKK